MNIQRHVVTPYITNLVGRALEPLLTCERKYYRLSRLCGMSWGEKSFPCTNEGVFEANGETSPCGCSTTLMIFLLYMTLHTTSGSLGLPRYITLINSMAHNRDVDDMTHDKIQHDSAGTFLLVVVCMSSCSGYRWWMSSWCATASPPHVKVHGVFDGCWFAWCFIHTFLLSCKLVRLTGSFICKKCMFIRPSIREHILHIFSSIREHIFACSSIFEDISLRASFLHSLVNMSFCMYSLCSSHPSSCHVCLCTCICSHSWWYNIKSKNLLVYHDAWLFWMQVIRRGDKVAR